MIKKEDWKKVIETAEDGLNNSLISVEVFKTTIAMAKKKIKLFE